MMPPSVVPHEMVCTLSLKQKGMAQNVVILQLNRT